MESVEKCKMRGGKRPPALKWQSTGDGKAAYVGTGRVRTRMPQGTLRPEVFYATWLVQIKAFWRWWTMEFLHFSLSLAARAKDGRRVSPVELERAASTARAQAKPRRLTDS